MTVQNTASKAEKLLFKRILLKVSGEFLLGDREYGIDPATVDRVANDIKEAIALGAEICIVVGGGNIFRGMSVAAKGMERATADYMGMLATVMNALALQSSLEKQGVESRVQSAIPMSSVCEPYIRRKAIRHMEKGRVVIFAAGLGSPFITTDTPAALRASEMNCTALVKATKVDGVYDKDPLLHKDAVRYDRLTYRDVLTQDLKVMDATAISLAKENNIPIVVFSLVEKGGLARLLKGQNIYTIIGNEE